MRPTSILALSLLVTPALAFRPDTPVIHDADRTVATGSLVHGEHPERTTVRGQATARRSAAWRSFADGEGAGWMARFDEVTGTPLRAWGPPIPLADATTAESVVAGLLAFVDRHEAALGVSRGDLRLSSAAYVDRLGAWYVDFDVLADGVPIEGAALTFRVRDGAIAMFGARTFPGLAAPGLPRTLPQRAFDRAIALGPAPRAAHQARSVDAVVVPVLGRKGIVLRPAWKTVTSTQAPRGAWVSLIDGVTGDLLGVTNDVRHLAGAVRAEHDERTVNGADPVTSPLPFLRVDGANTWTYADADGTFDLPDEAAATGSLAGRYFRVVNQAGPEASFGVGEGTTLVGGDGADPAERSAYVFAHHVRDWGLRAAPDVDLGRTTINVNVRGSCNAWYDGTLNFLRADSQCNNTGRIADIVYHEWGHGFHGESLRAGVWDGSMGEGIADTVAFLQTGDPRIGPYFLRNGGAVRNVAPDRVYPDDYTASADYVHSNGLIYAGAMWDLWGALVDQYGEAEGRARLEAIFTGMIKGGPVLTTAYAEAIFADDDDGDLSNGTPNQCAIYDAFQAHGLGPLTSGAASYLDLVVSASARADEPYPIAAPIVDVVPACGAWEADQAFVTYRVNGGAWQDVDLEVNDGDVAGAIPAQPLGSLVEFYVTAVDALGDELVSPDDGPIRPYSYYVGDVIEVFCTDLEDDDGGFHSALLSGEPGDGANDWLWGTPFGQGGDPSGAFSGSKVWANDLGEPGWNGTYQPDKHTRLETPPLDTKHYRGAFLHYQRWLTVEDGRYDQARITADDDVVWTNWDSPGGVEHHLDNQWQAHAVALGPAAEDGQVVVGWEIVSDGGVEFGGWTIDDVCVYAPATADNRLGVTDVAVTEGGRREVHVTWTNPEHAPLADVVVVRAEDRLPTSSSDGVVVATLTDVPLGAAMEVVDADAPRRTDLYYAVYPGDGQDHLSWTTLGLNAAAIRLGGGDSDIDTEGDPGEGVGVACGCSATGSPAVAWGVLALAGLLVRRRRG